jgi:hypothetical protein
MPTVLMEKNGFVMSGLVKGLCHLPENHTLSTTKPSDIYSG